MPHSFVQWIALFGMVGIGVLFLIEVRRWRILGHILDRKHQLLRIWLVILIEILFAMMYISPWITGKKDPITQLLYWTVCILIGFIVIMLALFDLLRVAKEYNSFNRRMFSIHQGDDQQDK